MNDRDQDHDEHEQPRPGSTGEGYPEETQPGMGIDARDHAEDDVADDVASDVDAPKSDSERDSEPSKATGNPHAAGG
ncbi:MAG: hypothetical protein KY433_02325 [Actinobacteria bacterium]|nr:hypothetical protein [Actinomycetota bacterium]